VGFAVWVLECSAVEAGGAVDNPESWVDVLEHIFWTKNAAFAYLRTRYFGPELFAALCWGQPYPTNPDYYHARHPTVATRRWIVRKKYIM
jgi:hypothetical protein